MKWGFTSGAVKKYVMDIAETREKDGKRYVLAISDCFGVAALGLVMDANMKEPLCEWTLDNVSSFYSTLRRYYTL